MSQLVKPTNDQSVPLPIPEAARQVADQFAQEQSTLAKAEAVRLNTLAVWVTHAYCQMMSIPSDLETSDSWNPIIRMMSNVADLQLPGIGQLECRPVRPGESACLTPPDVWDLRVGYVVVAIAEDWQTAQLLGFTPGVKEESLPLDQLQPPEVLFDHLFELSQTQSKSRSLTPLANTPVYLEEWLKDRVESGWQTVEALLASQPTTPLVNFRGAETALAAGGTLSDVRRAKLIDLAIQLGRLAFILVVNLQEDPPQRFHVGLQLHPAGGQPYLPPNIELLVLEPDGGIFMQAQARQADNYIQLRFSGEPRESFSVCIQLGNARFTEAFVI